MRFLIFWECNANALKTRPSGVGYPTSQVPSRTSEVGKRDGNAVFAFLGLLRIVNGLQEFPLTHGLHSCLRLKGR